jgi:creatinine amidohydrolase
MSMLDDRLTSAAIARAKPTLAVFGIGAVEQHSHHLPVGTDWIAVSELARRVAAELNALLVPAIPFSMSECHGPMAGTVWIKPATLAAVLRDVAQSLREQGIHRLLVLNGHGGNFVLEPVIQAINQESPDFRVVMPGELWAPIEKEGPIFETGGVEVHAGESETSTELYLNSENVRQERVDYVPSVGREFLDYVFMNQISPDGTWGVPSRGTAAKGERAMVAQVRAIVLYARQAFEVVE